MRRGEFAASQNALHGRLAAEREILGAMILEPETIGSLATTRLTDTCFQGAAHQTLFREIAAILKAHETLDLVTLNRRLEEKNLLEEVGGPAELSELVVHVSSISTVKHYIEDGVLSGSKLPE
jgi:replicative DNA helicase